MKTTFVARKGDAVARLALDILEQAGHPTQELSDGETPPLASIGLFGTDKPVRNRFLRLCRHRMCDEDIALPAWADGMPFVVAISKEGVQQNTRGFRVALQEMAAGYRTWGPWMKRPDAPWRPYWHMGEPHRAFGDWHESANIALAGTSTVERLKHRFDPIFETDTRAMVRSLVVTGCALFNRPHTDVTDVVTPLKRAFVLDALELAIHDAQISEVLFVLPRSDLLRAELRGHFHPFMFMSLEEVSRHLDVKLGDTARLFGAHHTHARCVREIAEALEASAAAIMREIVVPLRERTGVDVTPITWNDYVGQHIPRAHELAQANAAAAAEIYEKRVATRPSYASLHKIDPTLGLQRTISNNVFYFAEAMYLKEHPETVVANFEFESAFWLGLEEVLEREVWGSYRPFIGMAPMEARQPWGY